MKTKIATAVFLFSTLFLLDSCTKDSVKKDAIVLERSSVTLYHGNEYQIEATSQSPITYSSNDLFYASVSSTGKVIANHVGTTTIDVANEKGTEAFTVNVIPFYHTYPEPNINFGDTKAQVKTILGTPSKETENGILYDNYTSKCKLIILFEDGRVKSYAVVVPTDYVSELTDFLIERYAPIGMSEGTAYYINHDKTVAIAESVYNVDYLLVLYFPYSADKKMQPTMDRMIESLSCMVHLQ